MKSNGSLQVALACFAVLVLSGCGDNLPASANKTLSSHIDTSMTPQQRIQKIQNDPRYSEAKKADIIAHIKANNHLN